MTLNNLVERDIAIDLGTDTTLLYVSGKGIRLREPTIVAVDRQDGHLIKVGEDARKMLGRTPANIVAVHPITAGVISDYDMTAAMLKELIRRVTSFSLFKPRVLVCVPGSISGVEERAIMDAVIEAGGRKVYLVQSSVATAVGAGLDVNRPDGHMIIDIGGGTTEVAVVANGGVVSCDSIKVAGQSFDEAIVRYIRKKYNMLIGLTAAEELKRSIGCVMQRPDMGVEELRGRSLTDAKPKVIQVSANELIEAFVDPMNRILEAVHEVLEQTPPESVGDLETNGIIMSGGGSLLYGIDRLIERSTGIRTTVVDDPISCAAYGAGKLLKHLDEMQDGMMNYRRMRQLKL